jgi:hypothetical protein
MFAVHHGAQRFGSDVTRRETSATCTQYQVN